MGRRSCAATTRAPPGTGPPCCAHFRRIEGNNRLLNDLHGADGPLLVSDPGHVDDVSRWFVQSVQAMGEPFTHDFNGPTQRGVGFYQFMNRRGKRSSAAYAYVEPLKDDAAADRQAPRAACGGSTSRTAAPSSVTWRDGTGQEHTARARSDIVVAAGALVTPKLLMLSGLGPADHLRSKGIAGRRSTCPASART